jgi:septum site-determining protein MinD
VTNPEVSSVRDSDRIIGLLNTRTEKAGKGEEMPKHLLITRYDAARAGKGDMLSIADVQEMLSVPLLGVVPECPAVLRASNAGMPIVLNEPSNTAARAYRDAVRRLAGEDVPLTLPGEAWHLFGRLFRREIAIEIEIPA